MLDLETKQPDSTSTLGIYSDGVIMGFGLHVRVIETMMHQDILNRESGNLRIEPTEAC